MFNVDYKKLSRIHPSVLLCFFSAEQAENCEEMNQGGFNNMLKTGYNTL